MEVSFPDVHIVAALTTTADEGSNRHLIGHVHSHRNEGPAGVGVDAFGVKNETKKNTSAVAPEMATRFLHITQRKASGS